MPSREGTPRQLKPIEALALVPLRAFCVDAPPCAAFLHPAKVHGDAHSKHDEYRNDRDLVTVVAIVALPPRSFVYHRKGGFLLTHWTDLYEVLFVVAVMARIA